MKTKMKSFLIIGLGSFGHHLCRALARQKCEIMAVDRNGEALEDVLTLVTSAKIGDCTNPEVLKDLGVKDFDLCFVCMDGNFQNSLEITSLLKELGAKKVFTKVEEDIQAKFLLRNGADQVMFPEKEIAQSLAVSESSDNIFDCIELTPDYLICEVSLKPEWVGKSLRDLNFRGAYNLSVLAVKSGDKVRPMPAADYVFRENEHLVALGHIEDIRRLTR